MNEREVSRKPSADGGNSVCPACGQRFDCGALNEKGAAEVRCWCMQLPVAISPEQASGCYCRQCLQGRLAEQATGSAGV